MSSQKPRKTKQKSLLSWVKPQDTKVRVEDEDENVEESCAAEIPEGSSEGGQDYAAVESVKAAGSQLPLERFSFECRKVIGFALSTRCDWLKRFAPPFHPIRSKTKANCDALACIFPRFASATCNYFEF